MSESQHNNKVRPHLGVGWAFPVRPRRGSLHMAYYEEDIDQAIGIIVETARRERVMLPSFGAGLSAHVFSSNSSHTHRRIENEIEGALRDWEPRITVERVRAQAAQSEANRINIEIDYVVRRTNAFYNRVFPFYLNEAK